MKILGLDSSGLVAGVALVEDDVLVAEYATNYKKTHSQTLLPMLDELRRMVELDLDSLDAIAVASGPGSFTGLRHGQGSGHGPWKTAGGGAHSGGTCLESLPLGGSCLPPDGCQERSGIWGGL